MTNDNNKKAIDIGNLFAVVDENNMLLGVEVSFNANVTSKDGAVDIISSLSASIRNPRWIMNNIMRKSNAQTETTGDKDSDNSNAPTGDKAEGTEADTGDDK